MKNERGVPKRDGSGQGQRLNKGRGGCINTRPNRRQRAGSGRSND